MNSNTSANDQIRQNIEAAEAALKAALLLITESFERQLAGMAELPGRDKAKGTPAKVAQPGKRRGRPKKEPAPAEVDAPESKTEAEPKN